MSVLVISIEEAKLYLKIENDEENALIESFINTAQEICEGILRFPIADFEKVPETVKQAVLYIISNLYEKREETDMKGVIDVVKGFLFSYRKEMW